MQLNFTPEQEMRLSEIARHEGLEPENLVFDTASRIFGDDAQFRNAVQSGIEAADRREFVSDAEVWANVEKSLKPDDARLDATSLQRPI